MGMIDLVSFAYDIGLQVTKTLSRNEQKRLGQFMTPPPIARVMAARTCAGVDGPIVRVLDPAAGSGILAAAVVEQLLTSAEPPSEIQIVLCEIDPRLGLALTRLTDRLRRLAATTSTRVSVRVRIEDFLLSDLASDRPQFDVIIATPPYFKLNKIDPRAMRHASAVYGQPNIYGLFMAACARLLRPGGRWCFITPRSWTNGDYFKAVRRQMLNSLRIEALHIFDSRQDHFTNDAAQGIALKEGDLLIDMPDGTRIRITAGPSSFIAKDLIEQFALRHLVNPVVLWLSGSDRKSLPQFVELSASIGLRFDLGAELPDLILAEMREPVRFLFCEIVATDGVVTDARRQALIAIVRASGIPESVVAFLSAFEDRGSPAFRKNFSQIAVGSMIWFRTEPDLLVLLSVANRDSLVPSDHS